ncbi:ABC-type transport auxiliary lipoprotein family protein [Acinetobacter sp.]|uniref:PqiC family protein n=1 Tax=Acinetobacter sp. TaxID=472 RepID=UPI003341EB33
MKKIDKKLFHTAFIVRGTGVLFAAIFLSACSSSPVPNYYSLTAQVSPLANSKVTVIEVLPVGLPDRINRAPIVIQDVTGKSQILDNERWTSTLGTELRDNLSAGLQQKLGAVDRYNSGMVGGKISYRIATDFSRFDIVNSTNQANEKVEVSVAWIVKRNDPTITLDQNYNQNQQLACRMSFNQAIASNNKQMQQVVSTANSALNRVVDAVALSIISLDANKSARIDGVTCT